MRYRALSPSGDYTFGVNAANMLVNSPAAVAQAVLTAMLLVRGEWFLDNTIGVPYRTQILGFSQGAYDQAIRAAILGVSSEGRPVVVAIAKYTSTLNRVTRHLSVEATIDTVYGSVKISQVLKL